MNINKTFVEKTKYTIIFLIIHHLTKKYISLVLVISTLSTHI